MAAPITDPCSNEHTEQVTPATEHSQTSLVSNIFSHDTTTNTVAVADGYGITIRVHRGQLLINDGIGQHRRQRRYSRAQRTLRRIVILGHTGYLTLDTVRWCTDLGISIAHIDSDGRLLTVHADPGIDDPRIRRAQAAAATSPTGFDIARQLLSRKMQGQADILDKSWMRLVSPPLSATSRTTSALQPTW